MLLLDMFKGDDHDDEDDHQSNVGPGEDTTDKESGENTDDNTTKPCSHAETTLVNKKDPTCVEKGYTGDSVCLACASIVVKGSEIPTIDHNYDTGKITKEPTCIDTGVKTYTCSGCGGTKNEPVATVAHNDIYHDAEDGTHFHTCRDCTLSENKKHTPVDEGVAYLATCLEPAYVEFKCSECGGKYKVYDENQPALDHDFGDWREIKLASCRAGGVKARYCKRDGCNAVHEIDLPKNEKCNMVFNRYTTAPTCNAAGEALYVCTDCGKEETKAVSATGVHNYEAKADNGDGWTHKVCSSCGDKTSSYDASNKLSADLATDSIEKDKALEMDMEKATIQFPTSVVGQIAADETKNVSISADEAEATKKNEAIEKIADETVKEAIAGATVYDFTVTVDNKVFKDNFSTAVAITMPYSCSAEDADGIVIYYLAEDGTIETITDVVYDPINQTVTFFVEHFSFYAVAFQETQEMRCRRGDHDYQATSESVEASCHSFGYTVWECVCCHKKTVDNIVERLPHNYGELIEAKPTCSSGDYSHRICQNEGCGDVLLIQFKGATGHKIDAPATCTTPAICTKCGGVVYRALGHSWTEWEIVVKPTEVTNGLRRRNCSTCGIFEEITLAATGDISTITYNSYNELINLIFDKVLKIKNGTVTFELTDPSGNEYTANIKAQKNEGGYTLLMNIPGYSEENGVVNVVVYYRNGVFVADVPGEGIYSSDIDQVNPLPIDVFKAVLEDVHAELNYYVENYVKTARLLFAEYSPIIAADVDAILAASGSDFTVAKIEDLIDSVETVYAYLSLKLGYATNAEIIEGITLPEMKDFEAVVSAFTTLTEAEDGTKTYTYDLTKLTDALNTVTEWLEEKCEQTVAEFVYGLIEEKLLETNEELVDFDTFIDWLADEIPGTLTVADGVDKLLGILEDKEIVTIDSIYNLIDELAYKITGNNFSSKTYITSNGTATLNDFVGAMMGSPEATLDALYDMVKDYAAVNVVGDLEYQGITASYAVEYAKGFLESIQLIGGSTFVFDKDGNFVSMEFNEDFKMAAGTDEVSGETIYESFEKATLNVVRDDEIVIELPEKFGPAILDVKTSFDEEGNLIVEGLDDSFDLSFSISGSGKFDLDDVLTVDEKLSAELGYRVYVIDERFWRSGKYLTQYYCVDGKYYTAEHVSPVGMDINLSTSLTALASNPNAFLPDPNSEPDGQVKKNGELIPAWSIGIGIVYQQDGVWMFEHGGSFYVENEDNMRPDMENGGIVTFTEFAVNLRISHVNSSNVYGYGEYVEIDGNKYKVLTVYYYANGSERTFSKPCIIKDNEIFLIDGKWNSKYDTSYFVLTEIDSIPDRTGYKVEEYISYIYVLDENGERVEVKADVYEYSIPTPVYFVKIADGLYCELDAYGLSEGIYVGAYETMQLPDGNTFYIKSVSSKPDDKGNTVMYGYAKIAENLYVYTVCRVNGETVTSVEYRDATETYSASYREIYNVNDYITKLSAGKYKISKTLIDELKKNCTEPDSGFYICVDAEKDVDGQKYSNMYNVGCYYVKPEISLGDIFGGMGSSGDHETPDGENGGYNEYSFKLNDDGSLTIYFENGRVISGINYSFGNRFPVDTDKLVKDESGNRNGLDIYKLELNEEISRDDYFVYKDGKYYNYTTTRNVKFDYSLNPFAHYTVSNMTYQFDTVAAEGLEGGIPVYATTIAFRDWLYMFKPESACTITVYTFVKGGEIYVAKQAVVEGESVLKFESYVKLDEYMASLESELDSTQNIASYANVYCNGALITVGRDVYTVYETDAGGNRVKTLGNIECYYTNINGTKNYIYDYADLKKMVSIGSEVILPADKYDSIRYTLEDYYNDNVTIAECRYTEIENHTQYFVKLAGKYYRYNSYGCNCHDLWYGDGCYWCASISEDEFVNSSLDKIWYYEVYDENGNLYGYYSQFSVSDNGFVPQNQLYELVDGALQRRVFLGYTTDGYKLYEVTVSVQSAAGKNYTTETQADGTVFYHVDGIGYLKDQSGRYIPARKMLNANGEYEIVCRIHSAYLSENYVNLPGVLDAYVDVEIGNAYMTISPELLEIAKANRNTFKITLSIEYYGEVEINYYTLESLFNGKMNDGDANEPENGFEDNPSVKEDYEMELKK